ncbi:hypothetical protein JL721_9400 [Aureococcus anophagefferens]|nr:hypothetical protein JL721_9400 [Aureococcus anophagefferens]
MEHAPELDAVSGLDAVVLGPEAPEDAARRALRVPTLEHHVADPDAYLELYERHSWARRRGHGPPMLEGRPFFHEREVDDWQRPMACSVVVRWRALRAAPRRVGRREPLGLAAGPEDRWARATTFCTPASLPTRRRGRRVDFDGVLAKNKTTLSKRACAAVLRCDKRHRY